MIRRCINKKIFLYISVVFLISCSEKKEEKFENPEDENKVSQGVITYRVDYPHMDKETDNMYTLLPKHVTLTYKGNKYKTEVGVRLAGFGSALISDCENKQITTVLDMNGQHMYCNLTEEEIQTLQSSFPEVSYTDSVTEERFYELNCIKQNAVLENINREIEILSSKDIPIIDPNWCTPFSKVDGMLLRYEIEYYGLLMSFDAISIYTDTVISDKTFLPPDNYEKVPYFVIDKELNQIFGWVTND